MNDDPAAFVADILTKEFEGFFFSKGKRMWLRETSDRVLLLIAYQASRTDALFYLNFGAYFVKMGGEKKWPKVSDWHLMARYERFQKLSQSEYNRLFSLEKSSQETLEKRCSEIGTFAKNDIIPGLLVFGDYSRLMVNLSADRAHAFDPYWAQNVRKEDIAVHVERG